MRTAFALLLWVAAFPLVGVRAQTTGPAAEVQAQDSPEVRPNAVYLEALGNGGMFSWNYERVTASSMGFRVGIASWKAADFWGEGSSTFLTFPVTLSWVPGGRGSGLELGGGFLLGREGQRDEPSAETKGIANLTAILGYRWVTTKGWLLRAGFTPFYPLAGDYPDSQFFPSMGFSIGKAF